MNETAKGLRPVVKAKLRKLLGNEDNTEWAKRRLPAHLAYSFSFESSDCSALFHIIITTWTWTKRPQKQDIYPYYSEVKKILDETKKARDVRNKWAHCNLSDWTTEKFSSSFQTLIELVEVAICEPKFKKNLEELRDNGVNSLSGSYVNSQLLKSISEGIEELHSTVARNPKEYPGEDNINQTLNLVEDILKKLDKNHKENMEKGHRRTQEQNLENHRDNMVKGHRRTQEQNLDNHRENMEEGHRTTQKLEEDLKVTLL